MEAVGSAEPHIPEGVVARGSLKPESNEGSKNWYWLGLVIAVFTTVNYGFTSAAYARRAFHTTEEQWAWGSYYVTCAVLANVFFDLMAVREDIGQPLEAYYKGRIKPFSAASSAQKALTIAQLFLALIVAYCSFNTSFTTKIPGQQGIEAFKDDLPPGLSMALQIINSIYAGIFVSMLFVTGTFQLPGLIKDSVVWKKDQTPLEKGLLPLTLMGGALVGVGAYMVFLNTLWNFPAYKSSYSDPFNDYLKMIIEFWVGFAAVFPLTRGAFCILFAQRGMKELLEQTYALFYNLFKTKFAEACIRLMILAIVGVVAYGSIAPSIYQASTPVPHQIGDQVLFQNLIIACAFFLNALGLAKGARLAIEAKPVASTEREIDVEAASQGSAEEAESGSGDTGGTPLLGGTKKSSMFASPAQRRSCRLPELTPLKTLLQNSQSARVKPVSAKAETGIDEEVPEAEQQAQGPWRRLWCCPGRSSAKAQAATRGLA